MINAIVKAASAAIYGEFGSDYTIYAEDVEQGLKEPCFFISCISHSHELYLGGRYFRENQFCIQYFPAGGGREAEECHDTAERLESCLEYLDVSGNLLRGTKMHYEVADGICHFFVNYDCFVRRAAGLQDAMEEMENQANVKG